MRCQHKPRRGKDLVTDVSGTQYLLLSCVLCGCDVSVKLNCENQGLTFHTVLADGGRYRQTTPLARGFEFPWACGPPIGMKIGLSLYCVLMARGRRRSVYALDEVRPFLSLIGNARFEPIYVAPPSE